MAAAVVVVVVGLVGWSIATTATALTIGNSSGSGTGSGTGSVRSNRRGGHELCSRAAMIALAVVAKVQMV